MIKILTDNWEQYQLLDSGDYQKLERFGDFVLMRSEPRAWWKKSLPVSDWLKMTSASYLTEGKGQWDRNPGVPEEYPIAYQDLVFKIKLTETSKHVGVFPEQSSQWNWISEKIKSSGRTDIKILNLFSYTGASTMVCAKAGASVTHVDGSKPAMDWANENQTLSKLKDKPVRWILDDCFKFVKREVRRGSKYDAIILDPPAFGRGPQGQVWKIEEDLPVFMENCRELLSDKAIFVWLTAYTIDASSLSIANLVRDMVAGKGGKVEAGEMVIKPKDGEKVLPMSIFATWEK